MTIADFDRTRVGRLAALLAGLVLTAGCSSGASAAHGTAAASASLSRPFPAASPAPGAAALSAAASAPGVSVTAPAGDTVTYHGLQRPPAGEGWTALDVEVCAATGASSIDVSSASWRLVAADGSLLEPTSVAKGDQPTPRYPDYHLIVAGQCERAWVVFAGGAGAVRVAYQPDGTEAPVALWTL